MLKDSENDQELPCWEGFLEAALFRWFLRTVILRRILRVAVLRRILGTAVLMRILSGYCVGKDSDGQLCLAGILRALC